jgi:hypothetical protein
MRALHLLLTGLLILAICPLFPAVVRAQAGERLEGSGGNGAQMPDDEPPPDDDDDDNGDSGGIITHIFRLIFPVATMRAATENLLGGILLNNLEAIQLALDGLVAPLSLQNPGIKTGSGNTMLSIDVFESTWKFMVKIAVALWPATLAIMAAAAAQESVLSTSWGISGLKYALAQWVAGVLACAFSLDVLDLANRLSNALIVDIMNMPIPGEHMDLSGLVGLLAGAALSIDREAIGGLAAAIVIMVVAMVLGLAIVISLIGQYFARVALLYVIVALAPIVLVLGILRPARWLQSLWLRGVLLVMLLGPINALLLRLLGALFLAFDHPLLRFMMAIGLASVLLAINGAIIKSVFGTAGETFARARATVSGIAQGVQGVVTAGAAVGGAVLSGGAALGVLPSWTGPLGGLLGAAKSGRPQRTSDTSRSDGGQTARDTVRNAGTSPAPGDRNPSSDADSHQVQGGTLASGTRRGADATPAQTGPGSRDEPPAGRTGAAEASSGYFDRLREGWGDAAPDRRAGALGTGLRSAGTILGGRSAAGRMMSSAGSTLQTVARQQAQERGQQDEMGFGTEGDALGSSSYSPAEWRGYKAAMEDLRRDPDLRTALNERGISLREIERDAMAPVKAAAQHDTLTNVARQAGFGDRGDTASIVGDFVTYRFEQQFVVRGFLTQPLNSPGTEPIVPLSDTPAYTDYDRGQQIAWRAGGGDMVAYAGLHHAMRRYAQTPESGQRAADSFYDAAINSGSVAGVVRAAQDFGTQAGVPSEQLEPWLRML